MSINAQNISVSYGKFKALDNFSYEFIPGKVYVVVGPNGCGKSTLVKALVYSFSSKGIAYVAQETLGVINLTVREYVELGRYNPRKFFGGLSAEDRDKVNSAIEVMKLEKLENRIFDSLSGGEKQRVMAARAIAQDAEWTILDEPSSNLDVKHTSLIMNTMRDLCENSGKSFIVVLHDINDAVRYGDVLLMMKGGKLIKVTDKPQVSDFEMIFDTTFDVVTTQEGRDLFYSK